MRASHLGLILCFLLAFPLAAVAQGPGAGQGAPAQRLPVGEQTGLISEELGRVAPEDGERAAKSPDALLWQIERVDAPKAFWNMGPRSLILDTNGHPHIAYGQDHLYYAWHDGAIWHRETVDYSWGVGQFTALALDGGGLPHISYLDAISGDLKYAHYDGSTWRIGVVDSAIGWGFGSGTSLALDALGRPHISYWDQRNGALKHSYYDGVSWQREIVDAGGMFPGLSLDSNGYPHISYYGFAGGDLKYAYYDGAIWHIETVLTTGDTGGYTSLALDPANHPHISCRGMTNGELTYAHFDGAAWITTTVDTGLGGSLSYWNGATSLRLDTANRPHIGYFNYALWDLKYAHFDGSYWQVETVDSAGQVGVFASLALSGSDQPHISYYDYAGSDLKYAFRSGGSWSTQLVDNGARVDNTSLALDAAGQPHIAYSDAMDPALKYAVLSGTVWITTTVDSYGRAGTSLSVAVDSSGYPHIAYGTAGAVDLRYAYYNGTTWITRTVDSVGYVGLYSSLELDPADRPHIGYYDVGNGDLKYARFDGAIWHIETVDGVGSVGEYTSLALDAAGLPHISYYDSTNHDLKYARFDGATWHIETVDSAGDVGQYASLALDAAGHPHISYFDSTNSDLKYARFDGATWHIETVDSAGQAGLYTSLALAPSGLPHISYYAGGDLKYAYFDGPSWHIETVDSAGVVGESTSLALDTAGFPHVSYTDRTNGDLKYAWMCIPVAGASIAGPGHLPVGETGLYTATYTPPTATLPLSLAWDNGTLGPTAAYSWTVPGLYTLTVTATNACGQAVATRMVEVFCQPLEGVNVVGPAQLEVRETGLYTVIYSPPTATPPITLTWDNGTVGPTAAYSWTLPGLYTLTVTATNACGQAVGSYNVTVCQPLEGVAVSGPAELLTRETGLYTAIYAPPTATLPVTLTWDNGTVGPTAAYSWTLPGLYTLTVTATNACGQVAGNFNVAVCQPVEGVAVSGPAARFTGQPGTYTAAALPITASLPLTYIWGNGMTGPTAVYSWTLPGTYTLTVTASNPCGTAAGVYVVTVSECLPVTGAEIAGPTLLPAGIDGLFSAAPIPITASVPITYSWSNGTVSPTAIYSWTLPGTYVITLTAANYCGQGQASYTVTVFCQPITAVQVHGPSLLPAGLTGLYSATYSPITASRPLTFTWDNGTVGPTAIYSWTLPGLYTLTVTATNMCGRATTTYAVEVFCEPLEAIGIQGPPTLLMNEVGLYTAIYSPPTASLPLALEWDNGTTGPVAAYSWPTWGTYAIHLTATNLCSPPLTATQSVTVVYGLGSTIYPTMPGTLVFTDIHGNATSIQVPAGAVTETITLVYLAVAEATLPEGWSFAGHAFDLDAYREGILLPAFSFLKPVSISIQYAVTDVQGLNEDSLVLSYLAEGEWFDAATTCSPPSAYERYPQDDWLRLPICHLSRFALFGEQQHRIFLPLLFRGF